ncbi:MAG: hypothetical protein U1E35_04550 [Rhodospirillales bacterium]
MRLRSVTHLSTALLLLIYVLLGGLPPPVPAVDQSTVEICTASGLRIVPAADLPFSNAPSSKLKRDCPLCRIHAALLLPPVQRLCCKLLRSAPRPFRNPALPPRSPACRPVFIISPARRPSFPELIPEIKA